MTAHLQKVVDDLSQLLSEVCRGSDSIQKKVQDRTIIDRATVVYKADQPKTENEFPQILSILQVFWYYFCHNRNYFRMGEEPRSLRMGPR